MCKCGLGEAPEQEFIFRSSNQICFDVFFGSLHLHIYDLVSVHAAFPGISVVTSNKSRKHSYCGSTIVLWSTELP